MISLVIRCTNNDPRFIQIVGASFPTNSIIVSWNDNDQDWMPQYDGDKVRTVYLEYTHLETCSVITMNGYSDSFGFLLGAMLRAIGIDVKEISKIELFGRE